MLSELTFEIRPSPATNDHEVRVLVDGRDILGDQYIGIDPPEFFCQFFQSDTEDLLVGRCCCGVVGCGDCIVTVARDREVVRWSGHKAFVFNRTQYDAAVQRAAQDSSWEDSNRRAERLVNDLLRGLRTQDGFQFDWASARMSPNVIKLSFSNDVTQKFVEFAWDGKTEESATRAASLQKEQLVGPGLLDPLIEEPPHL